MREEDNAPEAHSAADPQKLKDDKKPGEPKSAHRDLVDSGKNQNKDTREELRKKH
jgi:hypothetical protein